MTFTNTEYREVGNGYLYSTILQVLELTGFQKENTTLKNENQALQSVIEGLRAERTLWSRELAEQVSYGYVYNVYITVT